MGVGSETQEGGPHWLTGWGAGWTGEAGPGEGQAERGADSPPPAVRPQLVMTVGLLAVVVYLYTVVAFNFFRKFYNKSEDEDEPDMKCDDMMTVSPPPRALSGDTDHPALSIPVCKAG